jgi:hypothetical protein
MHGEIPAFGADGLLPPGDYEVSFEELRQSMLILRPADSTAQTSWDTAWREQLVHNLEILTRQLWQLGIREVFADGSFAEDKDHPNDVDGYFVCGLAELSSGELARQLNLLDPFKVWTWDPASRKPYRGYPKKQLPMWHSTVSSCTHTCLDSALAVAFVTSMVTSWSFPRLSSIPA